MLDLNVLKVKKTYPSQKRRHTIEKYPVDSDISMSDDFPKFNLFQSLPSHNSPKSKRKVRGSIEGKVMNPYTTRPPARLLRNGKQRKLKEHLLDGLDSAKKRKRLCSDYSGSEISKLSGYESDSSFSDLSSIHSADVSDSKDVQIKKEQVEIHSGASSTIVPMEIKRSSSMESRNYCTDTNSNLCSDLKVIDNQKKVEEKLTEDIMYANDIYPNPSSKVPEKLLILDIMKQTFNENLEQNAKNIVPKSRPSIRDSTDDLLPAEAEEKESEEKKMSEIISKIVETMGTDEFTATINTTDDGPALVMQNGDIRENISWDDSSKTIEETVLPMGTENSSEKPLVEEEPPILEKIEDVLETHVISKSEEDIKEQDVEAAPETAPILQEVTAIPNNSELTEVPKPMAEEQSSDISLIEPEQETPAQPHREQIQAEIEKPPAVPSTSTSTEHTSLSFQETEEEVAIKENILNALGLQSLKAAEEAKMKEKEKTISKVETYTGTLKTVIKLNRDNKKKGKNHPLKMTLQKNKSKGGDGNTGSQDDYKIMKEASTSWKLGGQSSDTADGSSEHTSDGEVQNPEGPAKALVIPEKASSFSIHPERLCKDECSYCFGKFGLFDTPCHIAQIKSVERQDKILSIEKHLTRDSCLCDACYRHIDRKANTPSYVSKSFKRGSLIAPGPKENHCHVLGCNNVSSNVLRRKWIIKMKKQICQVINIDLDNPGLHSIPICDDHYIALEHLMVCAMCKRRLARNHIHYIGPEVEDLNNALQEEEIPLKLADKPVVCKLCKCFATVILKNADDRPENYLHFFVEYKKRLLHFNNIVPMDEAAAEEPIIVPTKEKTEKEPTKKKRKLSKNTDDSSQPASPVNEDKSAQNSSSNEQNNCNSRPDSPSDYLVDYNSLIPSIAMECEDNEPVKDKSKKVESAKKIPNLDSIKNAIDITIRDPNSDLAVQRLGSNPSLSVRQLFVGEEELGLQGRIDFSNVKEKTPEGWEKCSVTIQYDKETKQLWQELQKPYGNHSSFLRHLILLEKYFRNGDLELKPNASQQSINYSECVQNRLRAFDNIPTGTLRPLNVVGLSQVQKSNSGIISSNKDIPPVVSQTCVPGLPVMTTPNVSVTTVRPPPVTITQLNNPLISVAINKSKPPPPPGLISLLPGTNRPAAPLSKQPQSQKIKFPITKNWRPTLIPIDPAKPPEKKTGLVQVISGGKPFHITLEDYKKMCAIKRSFEMKQRRLLESQKRAAQIVASGGSLLKANKGLMITKGPVPKVEPKVEQESSESILEKLDQQVENLESKFNENKCLLNMPKIPKSLTVIPQTVARKASRPASPILLITQKPNPNVASNSS
ncbi:hypothetical protein HHI36_010136 [Cryptolaemus montrouzieri]|uniref:Uncharacterized protein n=1 Tax=Cryptolaemus montrouzieri TaxID=559131 RepID=A0ABD2MHW1_9CUCU